MKRCHTGHNEVVSFAGKAVVRQIMNSRGKENGGEIGAGRLVILSHST